MESKLTKVAKVLPGLWNAMNFDTCGQIVMGTDMSGTIRLCNGETVTCVDFWLVT